MQYTEQTADDLAKVKFRPLKAIKEPQDLKIDPSWEEIISPLDPKNREVFLRPLCQAATFERATYLMLPEALSIFEQNAIKEIPSKSEEELSAADQSALKLRHTLIKKAAQTEASWEKLKNGEISLDKHLRLLNANSTYLFNMIREEQLFHKFATANMVRERLKNLSLEGKQILTDQNISIEKFLAAQPAQPTNSPAIAAFENKAKMPLRTLLQLQLNIEEVREKTASMKSRFIHLNYRLVSSAADSKHLRGLDFEDLVSAGMMGMVIALENFDFNRNYKFSTYAYSWINQGILRTIKDNYYLGIAVPHNMQEDYVKMARQIYAHLGDQNKLPSPDDLSEATQMSLQHIKDLLGLPKEQFSLDTRFSADSQDKRLLSDTLADLTTLKEIERLDTYDQFLYLKKRLPLLINPDHLKLLNWRFNLGGFLENEQKSREYFASLDISKERARQISIISVKTLASLMVVSNQKLDTVEELTKDKISLEGAFLLDNILKPNPLPLNELLNNPIISTNFAPSSRVKLPADQQEYWTTNRVLGRTRSIVNNLSNFLVWTDYKGDPWSHSSANFSDREKRLFSLLNSRFFESTKDFYIYHRKELQALDFNTQQREVTDLIEKMDQAVMPELRAEYLRRQELR